MTNKEFKRLFMDATEAESWEAYFAEHSGDAALEGAAGTDVLENIWKASHLTFKKVLDASGLSQAAFADHFLIPYRTVQDWYARKSKPPVYIVAMLAELCGLVALDRGALPVRDEDAPCGEN